MATEYQRRPINVDEYARMAELGIIGPEERVELIEGEIVLMPPMGPAHVSSLGRLTELLVLRLAGRAVVIPQIPVRLSRMSEPEPDFAILARREDFYFGERPAPSNTLALIECAESSLRYDRGTKLRLYARSGISEYCIVNLVERCVESYRAPNDLGYAECKRLVPGDTLVFQALPDVSFAIEEMLGPNSPSVA